MPSYKNYQSKNAKHSDRNRTNIYEPEFNPTVSAKGEEQLDSFTKNINKYMDFIAWARWNPDLWFDLLTPETGGIRLDLDQRVFLRSVARFVSTYGVFPRGYGKCVSGDTLLYTENGVKEIGEYFNYIKCNKEIWTEHNVGLLNKDGEIERTNAGLYSGYLDTKKVSTDEGYKIEGTLNHPIMVMNEDGDIIFKKLENINVGDFVLINRNNDIWGNSIKIDTKKFNNQIKTLSKQKTSHLNIRNMPNKIDEDLSLFLGYLIGDGCLTLNNSIIFSNKDEDILNNYYRISKEKFDVKVAKKKGGNVDYLIHDKYLRMYLEFIGLNYGNAFEKHIPQIIMSSSKKNISKFLQGLFDTDGTVDNKSVSLCTVSEKLATQVQSLLLNFGIISRKVKYTRKNTFHYLIYIYGENIDKFHHDIGFGCLVKKIKINKIINKKRNTNKDIIPFQKNIINEFFQDVKKYNTYVYDKIYHILKGNNELTYYKLKYLLNLKNSHICRHYNRLKKIVDNNYFFSRVDTIEYSKNHVYDFSLPKTHSFVGNGFINHNTMKEVMSMYHTAIFYPDIELSMTAQTRENASKLIDEKHREILKFYPLIKNEITDYRVSKDSVLVSFTSGGRIDILANHQSTKGARRKRLNIEEAAQLNNELFEDVLEPIVNIPRRTIGKKAIINPEELNGQINFFTTSWFRGTDEFERNIQMIDEMAELKGKIVLGADWQLAERYGRGETKSQILDKKAKLSPTFFAMNYESKWVNILAPYNSDIIRKSSEPVITGCTVLILCYR